MPDIKFFELAAQVLPTIMIAFIIEMRLFASTIFPPEWQIGGSVLEILNQISLRQAFGIFAWVVTAGAFVVGEAVSLTTVMTNTPGQIKAYIVVITLLTTTGYTLCVPVLPIIARIKALQAHTD